MSDVCGRCNAHILPNQDNSDHETFESKVVEMTHSVTRWFNGRDFYGNVVEFSGIKTIEMPPSFDDEKANIQMDKIKQVIKDSLTGIGIKDMKTGFMVRCTDIIPKYVMVTLSKHYTGPHITYYITCEQFHPDHEQAANKTWNRGNKN